MFKEEGRFEILESTGFKGGVPESLLKSEEQGSRPELGQALEIVSPTYLDDR